MKVYEIERLKKNFPERLRFIMEREGMDIRELARKAPVSLNQARNWCSGVADPSFLNIMKIANALGVSIDELVGFKS